MSRPAPNPSALTEAADLLSAARAPVILAGGGAVRAAAIRELAEVLDAPVVMTTNARGLLPPDHSLGVSLTASMPETRALVAGADVVLALGTELGPTDYDMYEDGGFAIPGRLIRVDIDPCQIRRGPPADLGLVADAGLVAEALLTAVAPRAPGTGASRADAARAGYAGLSPAMRGDLHLLAIVRDTLPDALIVGDSTQLVYAGNTGFAAAVPGGYFNSATGFGTLGYGLPAAIGARIASDRPVVALSGDGGLQFVLGELSSAAEARAPVILLLHDNSGYGEIKSYMAARGVPPLGVDILTPDLGAIASACGWRVERCAALSELPGMLRQAASETVPTMLIFGDDLRSRAVDAALG